MPSNPDVVIRLERAGLGYGSEVVLGDVDLEIAESEAWFLLGPNGSGKTTILRTILGLTPLLAGEVWRSPERADHLHTGFVPQVSSISAALPTTVKEFVSLGAIGAGRPVASRSDDLAWALERVGLSGMQDKSYWSLSGGQRQRALVARALVRRPRLLVFDEPTEGLDAGSEEAFLETIDELAREDGATLLVVTHRLQVALRHATHVALVHDGIVESGSRAQMLTNANVERVFGPALAAQLAREAAGR